MCLVRTVQFQRTNVNAYAPPVFRLFYALLLIRIAAGQYTELLVVYPAEDIVLIQPLEQRIKLRCSFRQFFIFTLLGVKLPSVFRGAFFVDKFRKLSFSCSCRVGNTAQFLQENLIQYHLTDSVRRAFFFRIIAAMRAVEEIAFRIIRTLVIKIQFLAAIGTEQQTGILACFTYACRSVFTRFLLALHTGRFLRLFRQRKDLLFISFCMAAIISALTPFEQSLLLFCESGSELCFKPHNGYKRSAFVCAFLLYSALFFKE